MNTLKISSKKTNELERSSVCSLLDADFPDESNLPEELVAAQPQEESVIEKVERVLTPEEYQLLKRLVFDRASHLEVAQEFGISVYASQKRLERIREKLYTVFPERKGKRSEKFVRIRLKRSYICEGGSRHG